MADKDDSEDFFEQLQPLNGHFSQAFTESDEYGSLMQELADFEERYEDSSELDRGGMKSILSSTDKMTSRQVAKAKLLKGKSPKYEAFIKEARLTASLEHPNIIPVYDVGIDGEEPFFTMKMVEGENLSDLIAKLRENPQNESLQDLIQIFLKVCDAVAFAHSKKIIHLDLKPANIRLGQFGEVIVCDWGLAKIIGDDGEFETVTLDPDVYNDVTLDGMIKGSPGYLAPEQVSQEFGSKDEKTDIYALGGILYNLLTFKRPVDTGDLDQCLKDTVEGSIVHPLKINSKIPHSLAAVCMKALSVNKDDRYNSVIELRREINLWLTGFATSAEDANFAKSLWLLIKRHRLACSFMVVLLGLTVTLSLKILINEKRALEARELYLNEKENRRKSALNDAPFLFQMAELEVLDYSFDKALEYVNLSVGKDPDNLDYWNWKGKIHFFRQEFIAARKAFEKSNKKMSKRLVALSKEYSQLKADDELLNLEQLEDLIVRMAHVQYTFFVCSYADQVEAGMEYRLGVAMIFMRLVSNRHIKKWDYDAEIHEDYVNLDFSRMKSLHSIGGIRNLPIRKLNLNGTNISHTENLVTIPLEELNIKNTRILDPRPLFRIKTLKRLKVGIGDYQGIHIPKKINLERL